MACNCMGQSLTLTSLLSHYRFYETLVSSTSDNLIAGEHFGPWSFMLHQTLYQFTISFRPTLFDILGMP